MSCRANGVTQQQRLFDIHLHQRRVSGIQKTPLVLPQTKSIHVHDPGWILTICFYQAYKRLSGLLLWYIENAFFIYIPVVCLLIEFAAGRAFVAAMIQLIRPIVSSFSNGKGVRCIVRSIVFHSERLLKYVTIKTSFNLTARVCSVTVAWTNMFVQLSVINIQEALLLQPKDRR